MNSSDSSPTSPNISPSPLDFAHPRRVKPLPRLKRLQSDDALDAAHSGPNPKSPSTSILLSAPLPPSTPPPPTPSLPPPNVTLGGLSAVETGNGNPLLGNFPIPPYYFPLFNTKPGSDVDPWSTVTPASASGGVPGLKMDSEGGGSHSNPNNYPYPSLATTFSSTSTTAAFSKLANAAAAAVRDGMGFSTSMGVNLGMLGSMVASVLDEEEHHDLEFADIRDRDQQGNSKKRKVPNAQRGRGANDDVAGADGGGDELSRPTEYDILKAIYPEAEPRVNGLTAAESVRKKPPGVVDRKLKSRMSPSAWAGLCQKELFKARKRHLAVLLGPIALGDSLALDQALALRLPWHLALGKTNEEAAGLFTGINERQSTPSHRRRRQLRSKSKRDASQVGDGVLQLKEFAFKFSVPSLTSERMVATRGEVAILRSKFETELFKQSQKLAESARRLAEAAKASTRESKRNGDRRKAIAAPPAVTQNASSDTINPDSSTNPPAKPRNSKKKKRSAMANASNPHHLRNYVPSRVPPSNGGTTTLTPAQTALNAQHAIGPLPLRFLSAELPPRRSRRSENERPHSPNPSTVPNGTPPVDEWICSFCEYSLFYGEVNGFRRAVRSRKKVLSRRRRARERAAAAASGQGTAANGNSSFYKGGDSDEEAIEDQPARFVDPKVVDERVEATMRQMREKG